MVEEGRHRARAMMRQRGELLDEGRVGRSWGGSPGSWCGGRALVRRPAGPPRGEDGEGEEACDAASDGHAVESVYVPLIRSGVVAVHHGGFFHEPPPVAARHVDHQGDAVHHAPTGHVPREIAPALHRTARQAGQGALGVAAPSSWMTDGGSIDCRHKGTGWPTCKCRLLSIESSLLEFLVCEGPWRVAV